MLNKIQLSRTEFIGLQYKLGAEAYELAYKIAKRKTRLEKVHWSRKLLETAQQALQ